jgi:Uma2 family endonuclease
MAAIGLFQDQRVELIEGEVITMAAQSNAHVAGVSLVPDALRAAFGPDYWVRVQAPLHVGEHSAPEPDVAVVQGSPRDYTEHPTSALLVVEVSDRSLAYDRAEKASLYARGGIADYWIVNLVDGQVEIYREPQQQDAQRYGFGYGKREVASDGIAPLAIPQSLIATSDLLP